MRRFPREFYFRLLPLTALVFVPACSDSTRPELPGPVAAMTVVSGDDQTGVVGTRLPQPLVVRVTDSEGRVIPNQIVNFRVTTGGGSVFAEAAQTNAQGIAQELWTLGTVARDTQRVEVRAVDSSTGQPIVYGEFQAVGLPDVPARIERASTDGVQAMVGSDVTPSPRVRVTDQYGNGLSGLTVSFQATAGGGTVTGSPQVTDASGIAAVNAWTLGTTPGVNTLTATAVATPTLSVAFIATAGAGPAVQLVIDQPADGARAAIAFAQQPRITFADAYGNRVINVTAPVTISASSGNLSGQTTVMPSEGTAIFTDVWLGGLVDTYTLTYTAVLGGIVRSVAQPITLMAGEPGRLQIVQPAAGAAGGVPFVTQPIIRVVDEYGNFTATATNAVTITAYPGTTFGTTTVNAIDGVVHFTDVGIEGTGIDGAPGEYMLFYSAMLQGSTRTIGQQISVNPGSPAKYVVTTNGPAQVVVGTAINVTAQLTDLNGTALAREGVTVTWSAIGTGGVFTQSTSITNAAGVATTAFTADTIATSDYITITARDAQNRFGTIAVRLLRGAAAKLAFTTQPVSNGYGLTLPEVEVTVQDRYGNSLGREAPYKQVTLALATNPAGGTLTGGVAYTNPYGVVQFDNLLIDRPGNDYRLSASAPGLQPAISNEFDIAPVGIVYSVSDQSIVELEAARGNLYTASSPRNISGSSRSPDQTFYRLPRTGGPLTLLSAIGNCCAQVLGDENHVIYLNAERLGSGAYGELRVAGDASYTVDEAKLFAAAFDGQYVYVSSGPAEASSHATYRTFRIDVATNQALDLLNQGPLHIAAENGILYFVEDSLIKSVPSAGGTAATVTNLGSGVLPGRIVVRGGIIYAIVADEIRTVPVTGGTMVTRASGLASTGDMKIDDNALYVSSGGALVRYLLTNFTSTVIAPASDNVGFIALDSESVYWTSYPTGNFYSSTIKKARK